MNKLFSSFLLSIALLAGQESVAQVSKVVYGSNNGKYISLFNTKIYYEEYGKGMPLILLQGGMGSIRDFEKCIPELAKHYRVIAPDTPGQGRSQLADSMSYPLLAAYFEAFVDQLKLDSAYIMGWSDGGIAGLLLAEKRPDKIKRVLAVGANYDLPGAIPVGVDLSMVQPMPIDQWEKENKEWIDNYMKQSPRDWKKLLNDSNKMWYQKVYFSKALLEKITIPVMIAQGDKDFIRIEHALEMHRLIKNSQFCIVPHSSHAVFTDQPKLINEIAIGFFIPGIKK